MQNHYERLFHELSGLLSDEDVRDNLDQQLRERISLLAHQRGEPLPKGVCRTEQSLARTPEDMCHKF